VKEEGQEYFQHAQDQDISNISTGRHFQQFQQGDIFNNFNRETFPTISTGRHFDHISTHFNRETFRPRLDFNNGIIFNNGIFPTSSTSMG
jgi:hypothetical protein